MIQDMDRHMEYRCLLVLPARDLPYFSRMTSERRISCWGGIFSGSGYNNYQGKENIKNLYLNFNVKKQGRRGGRGEYLLSS